jgi:hypothetical protein
MCQAKSSYFGHDFSLAFPEKNGYTGSQESGAGYPAISAGGSGKNIPLFALRPFGREGGNHLYRRKQL